MNIEPSSAQGLFRAAQAAAQTGPSADLTAGAAGLEPPAGAGEEAPSFTQSVTEMAETAVAGLGEAERLTADMMVGKAEPHSVVEALAQTELALETAVAVRDRVVSAYQEILRMPI